MNQAVAGLEGGSVFSFRQELEWEQGWSNPSLAKTYQYVGDSYALSRIADEAASTPISDLKELLERLRSFEMAGIQTADDVCTYVVDEGDALRIAPRRSEHVVCAGGEPVRAAGEVQFAVGDDGSVEVEYLSNQSTGYCPDLPSWHAVERALDELGVATPDGFSRSFVFRRCENCDERSIIKDDWFECVHCGAELPANYNF